MSAEKTNLKCPKCGANIDENTKFCGKCGNDVSSIQIQETPKSENKCPNCGADISENTKFCGKCGSDVTITKNTSINTESYGTTHVGGVRFNLPRGFMETSKEDNKYIESSEANTYKHIYKRNEEVVTITVATYKHVVVDEESVRKNAEKNRWTKSVINDVETYLEEQTGNVKSYKIVYTQLNRYIVIISNSEISKEFVVKNNNFDYQNLPQTQYKHSPNTNKLIYGIFGLCVTLFIMYRAYTKSSISGIHNILFYLCILFLLGDFYYIYRAYKGKI